MNKIKSLRLGDASGSDLFNAASYIQLHEIPVSV